MLICKGVFNRKSELSSSARKLMKTSAPSPIWTCAQAAGILRRKPGQLERDGQ